MSERELAIMKLLGGYRVTVGKDLAESLGWRLGDRIKILQVDGRRDRLVLQRIDER